MLISANVLVIDTGLCLRDQVEAAGAETITVASIADAIQAIERFTFDCAILSRARTAFDLDGIVFILKEAGLCVLYAGDWIRTTDGISVSNRPKFGADDHGEIVMLH